MVFGIIDIVIAIFDIYLALNLYAKRKFGLSVLFVLLAAWMLIYGFINILIH